MGFRETVFGGRETVKFKTVPQTPGATKARTKLEDIAFGEPPAVPLQQIAGLPPITEERKLARTTAKELIQPQDIFSLPEVQGIILEARQTGNLLGNRLARMLQSAGSLTSTPGRDILGRAVTDVQKSLTASLAPFATEERRRRERLIPILESLGLTEEERERFIEQAEFDAQFRQETTKAGQLESFTIPQLRNILSDQPAIQPFVQEPLPGLIEQIGSIAGLFSKDKKKGPLAGFIK